MRLARALLTSRCHMPPHPVSQAAYLKALRHQTTEQCQGIVCDSIVGVQLQDGSARLDLHVGTTMAQACSFVLQYLQTAAGNLKGLVRFILSTDFECHAATVDESGCR